MRVLRAVASGCDKNGLQTRALLCLIRSRMRQGISGNTTLAGEKLSHGGVGVGTVFGDGEYRKKIRT